MVIKLFNEEFPKEIFHKTQIAYLNKFQIDKLSIEEIHAEMDLVWDSIFERTNFSVRENFIQFYSHPVWLLNAFFTKTDKVSVNHRKAISGHISKAGYMKVLDYGGGGGSLAERIVEASPLSHVDIYEPFASNYLKYVVNKTSNIEIIDSIKCNNYEVIVLQDVLEHLNNPVNTVRDISRTLKVGSIVIFANCFYPQIKCHLSSNFYLRHTFKYLIRYLGFNFTGTISGAEHAQVFEYTGKKNGLLFTINLIIAWLFGSVLNKFYPWLKKKILING